MHDIAGIRFPVSVPVATNRLEFPVRVVAARKEFTPLGCISVARQSGTRVAARSRISSAERYRDREDYFSKLRTAAQISCESGIPDETSRTSSSAGRRREFSREGTRPRRGKTCRGPSEPAAQHVGTTMLRPPRRPEAATRTHPARSTLTSVATHKAISPLRRCPAS